MLQANHTRRWFEEVWHKGNENAIDELLHNDAIIHGLETDKTKKGPEAFKPFYKSFREAFPAVRVDIEPIIVTEEYEAVYCTVTVQDKKNTPDVIFKGLNICKFKNGKIIEGWNAYDFMTMYMKQGYKLTPPDMAT